jgi:hypothetical protein
MRHYLWLLLLLGVPMPSTAQTPAQAQLITRMKGLAKVGYQGMDIWRDYIVSCQNTGIATIYRYDGKVMTREGEPFRLASYDVHNHSNVASFGRSFYDRHDKLPVLYVSQAYKEPVNGKKDLLYVERINPEKQTSELVQTICFDDVSHLFGYALQWVVDNDHHFLYGYGNTISNSDPKNRHRLVKFHIPPVKGSPFVTLTEKDLLENYLLEDTYKEPFNPIGQGLYISHGLLYMPVGLGKEGYPSLLYVWNLKKRHMDDVIDLTKVTTGELEDCSSYHGKLIVQGQDGMFKIGN